jgi:hypothetical protein
MAHANFAGHFFNIPLNDFGGGENSFTEKELYNALASIFAYVFLDLDTATSFQHSVNATKATDKLGKIISPAVTAVKNDHTSTFRHMMGTAPPEILKDYGTRLIDRLFEGGKSIADVVWTLIPTAAAAVATQAQGVSFPKQSKSRLLTAISGRNSSIFTCPTIILRTGQRFRNSQAQMHLKTSRN